jgi:iron complex outermembrane recepter protein
VYQTNFDKRSLRSALLLGAASAAALSMSLPASAQESTETVVVTGSRIPQQGLYSATPVTSVGQEELKFEGTSSVETLLNNLPSVFAGQTSGVSNGSSGTATVDLRDLGAARTLVLVNDTRMMPGDPTVPVPDLNQIPAALIDHVEVLTGAASTVYGSDAVAGVVNFIMRKDFEGVEFDGQYGITEADNDNGFYRNMIAAAGDNEPKRDVLDGGSTNGTLIFGVNSASGKGNIEGYVGYENQEPVVGANRDFATCTMGGTSVHSCAGSSNYNRWFSLDNAYASLANYDYFETGTGAKGTGTFTPYTGSNAQHFNFGALNYLERPDTRYSGGFFAHYEVNKQLDIYASFMFTDDHTIAQIAEGGLFLGDGTVSGFADNVNCGNPLMSGNEAAQLCGQITPTAGYFGGLTTYAASHGYSKHHLPTTLSQAYGSTGPFGNGYDSGNNGAGNLTPGQAKLEIGRRNIEGGDRTDDFTHISFRTQVGARGDLGDGWTYDVYAQYGYTATQSITGGYFSEIKVQNALETTNGTTCTSCAKGCVPIDIFDGIGSLTPAMENYLNVNGFQTGYTEEQIISGSLTGDLGAYGIQSPWAKSPVAVSIGSEYRAEYLETAVDNENATGDLEGGGGVINPVPRSGFSVAEGFTELKIPLIQEKPWAEDLTADAGYRYSSYSTAGSVSSYKYGVQYQPIDDFRIRASFQRAVRAPNVVELFSPATVGLFSGQDPCASPANATINSNCLAEGVTNTGKSFLNCPANQCQAQSGGNTSLRPETGATRSAGIVFTPTFLDGFTATVDYWDIDLSGDIGAPSPNYILAQCYGTSATAGSQAEYCPLVKRSAGGQIYGAGFVQALNLNLGFVHTKGVDIGANYQVHLDDYGMTGMGSLQASLTGTYLQSFVTEPVPGGGTYDCAGLFGQTCGTPLPRWRHKLRLTWATPWDVDLSLNWRHLSTVKLDVNTNQALLSNGSFDYADRLITDYDYFDLAANWNVRSGIDLHVGINNIFNKNPPTLQSGALPTGVGNDNTFPGTYDSLGRVMFVGVTLKN